MKKRLKRRMRTKIKLANVLENIGDPKLDEIIRKAKAGYYDDYGSPLACPITQLFRDLENAGFPELADRARNGEWDAQRWEALEWRNGEGAQLFKEFLQKKKHKFP